MKKLLLSVLLSFAYLLSFSQGVDFKQVSFTEALKMAKNQNKMLFVDCYTSWCGPCKFMAKEIFTQKEVGDYFNNRFIAVKYDVEKEEAREFNEHYTVKSFPTFFLFSPKGEVIYRMGSASQTAKEWLERMATAVREGKAVEKACADYRKSRNAKTTKAYMEALSKIQDGEGLCNLFIEEFKAAEDKIDFLYENKNLLTKTLSDVHFNKFLKALKSCEGYIPEMDEIFKGTFY